VPAQRCPACGLVNPATAERCDCGRSFVDGSQGAPLRAGPARRGVSPGWYVLVGSIVMLLLALFAVSMGSTSGGGVLGVLGVVGLGVGRIWLRVEH
jgi:hypothetical protein